MTDRRNATKEEKSEARRRRFEARSKLGLKPGDGKEAHHVDGKGGSTTGYNNSDGNLKAVSRAEHEKKENNGRPKGSKDTVKRKSRKE